MKCTEANFKGVTMTEKELYDDIMGRGAQYVVDKYFVLIDKALKEINK